MLLPYNDANAIDAMLHSLAPNPDAWETSRPGTP